MPFSMYHEGKSQEGTSLFSCIVFAVLKTEVPELILSRCCGGPFAFLAIAFDVMAVSIGIILVSGPLRMVRCT